MDMIEDIRTMDQLKVITFSKYKRCDVKKEWLDSMVQHKIESSCHWTTELICSGLFSDLWELILLFYAKYIHSGNPKLPIYLDRRFQWFKQVAHGVDELSLRNNVDIRKLFIEMVCILCISKRTHSYEMVKIPKDITIPKSRLVAPTIDFNKAFKPADPKELIISMNEFGYMLHTKNVMGACFWIEWMIQFMQKHKCVAVDRPYCSKYKTDAVWLIWDTLLGFVKNPLIQQILESIIRLFTIAYSPACKERRRFLLYYAISLVCDPIQMNVELVSDKKIISQAYEKCGSMFKEIKKQEVK